MTLGNNCFNKRVYPTKSPELVRQMVTETLLMCCHKEQKKARVKLIQEKSEEKIIYVENNKNKWFY